MKLVDLFNSPPVVEDYASSIPHQLPDFNPRYAKVVGNEGGRDVWGSRCWQGIDVFAFRNDEKLEAFIALSTVKVTSALSLIRAWCDPSYRGKGLVSALLGFVTKKMGEKIIVTKSEPLTQDGINWLIKLIKNPHGLNIHDGSGKKIDPSDVYKDWEDAKNSTGGQKMQLIIENERRWAIWGNNWPMLESAQHLNVKELD